MKVIVLGSGTSSGVPIPGCGCRVCTSRHPLNKRLRTSLHIELHGSDRSPPEGRERIASLLVDSGTDLRAQALTHGIVAVEHVLYTHTHADHVCGIDDLRSFNFTGGNIIDAWASTASAKELERMFGYAFFPDPTYQGGAPPRLRMNHLQGLVPLHISGVEILPVPVLHGTLEVMGCRIGKFAYITDCSHIPEPSMAALCGLDTLILDGLRTRPHPTHFTHEQAVAIIEQLQPEQSYLTHITHDVDHEEGNENLRRLTRRKVELAYDGLTFDF